MTDEIKDQNIRDIRELARAVSDELSRENPKYIDSLRDHFAGLAMAAHISLEIYAKGELMSHEVAEHAYGMADAMLAAREQRT